MSDEPAVQVNPVDDPSIVVRVDQVPSPQFRVIHVNGVMGGANQFGDLCFTLYSERGGLLDSFKFRWHTSGKQELLQEVGDPDQPVVTRRELETTIVMSVPVAQQVVKFMSDTLQQYYDVGRLAHDETVQQSAAYKSGPTEETD